MQGIDFSQVAIDEATRRAATAAVDTAIFRVADATEVWPYDSDSFDFCIDCFASCDLETERGRADAVRECYRVIRPGGYALAYLLSTDDEYFLDKSTQQPADEPHSFYHSPSGKFEKSFTAEELVQLYGDFRVVAQERFAGGFKLGAKYYSNMHWWCVFKKL